MTTPCPFVKRALCTWLLVAGLHATPARAQTPAAGDTAKSADAVPSSPGPKATFFGFVQTHYRHAFETGDDGVFDAPNFRA